jgi:hypothetical protein
MLATVNTKEEVSIKVHCIVSCFCEVVKRRSHVDYRPFYFGVWDAPFDHTETGEITYFQNDLRHDYFLYWFEQLFGTKVNEWYDTSKDKASNLATFLDLIENCPDYRYVIVQVDLSLLPERENKFHQKPFPHFLMIAKTDHEDEWFMCDPDFRWEGVVSREKVVQAIVENPFGGGFYIDAQHFQEPTNDAVERLYTASFDKKQNELTDSLIEWIPKIAQERDGCTFSMLTLAVKQLPVLAIRKYGYEHALMYFMEQTGFSEEAFEYWANEIERVVKGFSTVQFKVMKMAMTHSVALLPSIVEQLTDMNAIELRIKQELERQFQLWKSRVAHAGGAL